jgi:hypothetical protein
MKRASCLVLGVVVLFGMVAFIAWLDGYLSHGDITIKPSALPTIIFCVLLIGFAGGCAIGIFFEANVKDWLAQYKEKMKKQLEKIGESK